jgi:hypothetical protein
MKQIHKISFLFVICILLVCWAVPAAAQDEQGLDLRLNRDFGYSSGAGQIQGTFSMRVSGPEDLQRVIFMVDGDSIGEVTGAPFRLQFRTDDYALGVHTMSAVGYTADGRELHSAEVRREFVSAQAGWQAALRIIIPVGVIVLLITLVSALIPALTGRGKSSEVPLGAPRKYGVLGGTVCPKCGRPFSRHWWGINLLAGKLDRCPYCGKWSLTQGAHPSVLRAAEEAELAMVEEEKEERPEISEEERLKRSLEESRFEDI